MTQPKIFTRGVKLWVRFSLNGEVIKRSLNIEDSKANRKLAITQMIPQMLLKVYSGEFFENTIVPTVKDMITMSLEIHQGNRKLDTDQSKNDGTQDVPHSAGKGDPCGFGRAPFSGAVHHNERQIMIRSEQCMHKAKRRRGSAKNDDA